MNRFSRSRPWLSRVLLLAIGFVALYAMRLVFPELPTDTDLLDDPGTRAFFAFHAIGSISWLTLLALGVPNPSQRRWMRVLNWFLRGFAVVAGIMFLLVYSRFLAAL